MLSEKPAWFYAVQGVSLKSVSESETREPQLGSRRQTLFSRARLCETVPMTLSLLPATRSPA